MIENKRPRIALVSNTSWFLQNFRMKLVQALQEARYDIVAITPEDEYTRRLTDAGIRHRHFPLSRTGLNPIAELRSILSLRRAFREENIDLVLSFTPKGNIYSCFAGIYLPANILVTVCGMGRVFVTYSWKRVLVSLLYRSALSRAYYAFVENNDDMRFLIETGCVDKSKCERILGQGVDLDDFVPPAHDKAVSGGPLFLLFARLIWEKGLAQYADAARAIRAQHPLARFQIIGMLEKNNPSAIPQKTLDGWVQSGTIEYLGTVQDVRPYLEKADCVVLPSFYREGVPRSLMEAAAMAKPIITTDMPGCRDTVDDGVTGFICQPKNTDDLISKLQNFIGLSTEERRRLGLNGRAKMEREFDERIVVGRYLSLVARSTSR